MGMALRRLQMAYDKTDKTRIFGSDLVSDSYSDLSQKTLYGLGPALAPSVPEDYDEGTTGDGSLERAVEDASRTRGYVPEPKKKDQRSTSSLVEQYLHTLPDSLRRDLKKDFLDEDQLVSVFKKQLAQWSGDDFYGKWDPDSVYPIASGGYSTVVRAFSHPDEDGNREQIVFKLDYSSSNRGLDAVLREVEMTRRARKVLGDNDDPSHLLVPKMFGEHLRTFKYSANDSTETRLYKRFLEAVEGLDLSPLEKLRFYQSQRNRPVVAVMPMEYLDAVHLNEVVKDEEQLDMVKLFTKLVEGVWAVHRMAGIAHRDIKPQNILVKPVYRKERDGRDVLDVDNSRIYLIDWGIARQIGETAPLEGTLAFPSLEAMEGQPVSPAHDVQSLGWVLRYITTGENPLLELEIEGKTNKEILDMYIDVVKNMKFPKIDRTETIKDLTDVIMSAIHPYNGYKSCNGLVVGLYYVQERMEYGLEYQGLLAKNRLDRADDKVVIPLPPIGADGKVRPGPDGLVNVAGQSWSVDEAQRYVDHLLGAFVGTHERSSSGKVSDFSEFGLTDGLGDDLFSDSDSTVVGVKRGPFDHYSVPESSEEERADVAGFLAGLHEASQKTKHKGVVEVPYRAVTVPQKLWDAKQLHDIVAMRAKAEVPSKNQGSVEEFVDPREWFDDSEYRDFTEALASELEEEGWDPEK